MSYFESKFIGDDAETLFVTEAARKNHSSRAHFTHEAIQRPFAKGTFRLVAKGKYVEGPRIGEECVAKWFKIGTVFEYSYFKNDFKVMQKALEIIEAFNKLNLVELKIRLNTPQIWKWGADATKAAPGSKALVEPFIQDYTKFNSNSGWNSPTAPYTKILQALSHFSYHYSNRSYLLCDLQGGVYNDSIVLSDPVIMSHSPRAFGPTDLGREGISSFFNQHVCNNCCRSDWLHPGKTVQFIYPSSSTTMQTDDFRPRRTDMDY